MNRNTPPLVVHIIHRLDYGGLENGLVNLIQNMPHERYRHAIICLTDYSEFSKRITRDDVAIFALDKKEGKDPGLYIRLWKLLRHLSPDIVHTRNLAALECSVVARLAGVPVRVHGEHGWDVYDLDGRNWKYTLLRKGCRYFLDSYIALSRDTLRWLKGWIKVPGRKIVHICNGVDAEKFHPAGTGEGQAVMFPGESGSGIVIFGTVGRMEAVKDPLCLASAFVLLLYRRPDLRPLARLAMIGDGALRHQVLAMLEEGGVTELAFVPGARDDIAALMRELDVFVLPSLNEGISNTILEAMATGLPVVATDVGGNPELVVEGRSGVLVAPSNPEALSQAMEHYLDNAQLRRAHGGEGRRLVEELYSLDVMVNRYLQVYDSLMSRLAG